MYELKLTNEQKILLYLTAKSISETPNKLKVDESVFENANWQEIIEESKVHTVPIATFDAVTERKNYVPQDLYERWKRMAMSVLSSDYVVVQSQIELDELMNGKYPYAILKGMAAGAYYPKPELRALGDVDFLIDPTKQAELEEFFKNAGYEMSQGDHPNHVVFTKPGAHLEMHFAVAGVPYGWQGEKVQAFLKETIFHPIIRDVEGSRFPAPTDMEHGLVLLLHMQHHMVGDGLGLRHLSDWATYVAKTYKESYWEETLIPFLKEIGLYTYAAVMTKICVKYLQIPCPTWAEEADDETCDEVMHDILCSGNFGRKDENRAQSGMLISERGKGGMKHGALYNLAHSLHKAISRMRVVKKYPILYPFIYVYKAVRFLVLSLFGKRPSLIKMAPEAQKRKSVYEKLAVFETERKEK